MAELTIRQKAVRLSERRKHDLEVICPSIQFNLENITFGKSTGDEREVEVDGKFVKLMFMDDDGISNWHLMSVSEFKTFCQAGLNMIK